MAGLRPARISAPARSTRKIRSTGPGPPRSRHSRYAARVSAAGMRPATQITRSRAAAGTSSGGGVARGQPQRSRQRKAPRAPRTRGRRRSRSPPSARGSDGCVERAEDDGESGSLTAALRHAYRSIRFRTQFHAGSQPVQATPRHSPPSPPRRRRWRAPAAAIFTGPDAGGARRLHPFPRARGKRASRSPTRNDVSRDPALPSGRRRRDGAGPAHAADVAGALGRAPRDAAGGPARLHAGAAGARAPLRPGVRPRAHHRRDGDGKGAVRPLHLPAQQTHRESRSSASTARSTRRASSSPASCSATSGAALRARSRSIAASLPRRTAASSSWTRWAS